MMEEMNKWLSDYTVPFTGHSSCSRIVFLLKNLL